MEIFNWFITGLIVIALSTAYIIKGTPSKLTNSIHPYFCRQDSDCVTYCGYSYDNLGRGDCVNRNYAWKSEHDLNMDVCCLCEYVGECNSCSCQNNVCMTHFTNLLRC